MPRQATQDGKCPHLSGAGALPVGAKLPTVDDQGHLLPGIGMAPGHSPLSLQISGVPQWGPGYLAASKAREGAGRPTGPSGPQLISGKGVIGFQLLPCIPERLLFGAASPPPSEIGSWQLFGSGLVPGSECNLTLSLTGGRQTPCVFSHPPEASKQPFQSPGATLLPQGSS